MRPVLILLTLFASLPATADGLRRGFDVPDPVEAEERVIATPWTLDVPADRREGRGRIDGVVVDRRQTPAPQPRLPSNCVRTANGETWCRR